MIVIYISDILMPQAVEYGQLMETTKQSMYSYRRYRDKNNMRWCTRSRFSVHNIYAPNL